MYNPNPTGVQERSIAMAIVLTIVTCGIYGLYWIYKLHDEANALSGRTNEMSPALVVFLVIITCGIYQVYWAYTQGEKFREEAQARGSSEADDCPVLYLVMEVANYFVGVTSIINKALMQDRINQILRRNGWGNQPYDADRFRYSPEADIAREYERREQAGAADPFADPGTNSAGAGSAANSGSATNSGSAGPAEWTPVTQAPAVVPDDGAKATAAEQVTPTAETPIESVVAQAEASFDTTDIPVDDGGTPDVIYMDPAQAPAPAETPIESVVTPVEPTIEPTIEPPIEPTAEADNETAD